KKRDVVTRYVNSFNSFEDLIIPDSDDSIFVRFPIVFRANVSDQTISNIKEEALRSGFNFGQWFNDVVHPKGSLRYCYEENACPNGEFVSRNIINLPVNINRVITEVE